MPELTVIIPCYNEAKRLPPFFALIEEHADLPWEWLFVDDGSSDNTKQLLDEFAGKHADSVRVHSYPVNRGKGNAVQAGMLEAKGDLVGFVDADLAANPIDFKDLLDEPGVRDGKAILIGMRLLTHERKVKRVFSRHLMGRIFQTLASNATGLRCYDSQCGFKLMSQPRARELAAHINCGGFCFDVEMLMIADRLGMKIIEKPIAWEEKGESRIRLGHIITMFFDIWRIRKRVDRQFPRGA